MKLNKLLAPLVATTALALAPMASQAGLIIQITDGTNTLSVADGSALDGIAAAGGVSYFGSFSGWTVSAGVGTSAADPLSMHLTATVMGDRTDGRVWIKFTHTDLEAAVDPMTFAAFGGGAGARGAEASWAGYVDDSNAAFGTGQMIFGANGFSTAGGSQTVALNDSYSATLVASFDYRGVDSPYLQGSAQAMTLRVPEPATPALIALGLLGLGLTRRRAV